MNLHIQRYKGWVQQGVMPRHIAFDTQPHLHINTLLNEIDIRPTCEVNSSGTTKTRKNNNSRSKIL